MTLQEKIWMDELHRDMLQDGQQDTMTEEKLTELAKIHGEE